MFLFLSAIKWGDVPAWVTAAATVLAFFAASYAAWRTGRIVKIELDRDRVRGLDEEKRQASQVAVWATQTVNKPVGGPELFARFTVMSVSGYVVNGSNQPVFNIVTEWFVDDVVVHMTEVAVLPPSGNEQWEMPDEVMALFDSEIEVSGYRTSLGYQEAQHLSLMAARKLRLQVEFDDSHGRRWVRDRHGELRQLMGEK